jgi:hypothetical protein
LALFPRDAVLHEVRSVPLQRSGLCEVGLRSHLRHRFPRGVEVPFRVFQDCRLGDSLGSFVTCPSCRLSHAGVRLQGARPTVPAVRRDSHDHPLFGFRSPTGFDPLAVPHVSRHPAPLLGFPPLQRLSVGGVYVTSACGPIRRLRSVRRVSTLSTVCSSPHLARTFRRKQHSWGSPFRGFPSRAGPRARRSRVCPLGVVPSACALSS